MTFDAAEKKLFQVQLTQRRKESRSHMKIWIEKVEVILQKYDATNNENIESWFYPMPKEWKEKFK